MNAWLVVLLAGAGSLLLRLSMIVAADRFRLPAQLDQASALVAPAAFAALAATSIAGAALDAVGAEAVAPLAAVGVAVLVVARTGSRHAAVLVGMPTLWLTSALLAA